VCFGEPGRLSGTTRQEPHFQVPSNEIRRRRKGRAPWSKTIGRRRVDGVLETPLGRGLAGFAPAECVRQMQPPSNAAGSNGNGQNMLAKDLAFHEGHCLLAWDQSVPQRPARIIFGLRPSIICIQRVHGLADFAPEILARVVGSLKHQQGFESLTRDEAGGQGPGSHPMEPGTTLRLAIAEEGRSIRDSLIPYRLTRIFIPASLCVELKPFARTSDAPRLRLGRGM